MINLILRRKANIKFVTSYKYDNLTGKSYVQALDFGGKYLSSVSFESATLDVSKTLDAVTVNAINLVLSKPQLNVTLLDDKGFDAKVKDYSNELKIDDLGILTETKAVKLVTWFKDNLGVDTVGQVLSFWNFEKPSTLLVVVCVLSYVVILLLFSLCLRLLSFVVRSARRVGRSFKRRGR